MVKLCVISLVFITLLGCSSLSSRGEDLDSDMREQGKRNCEIVGRKDCDERYH